MQKKKLKTYQINSNHKIIHLLLLSFFIFGIIPRCWHWLWCTWYTWNTATFSTRWWFTCWWLFCTMCRRLGWWITFLSIWWCFFTLSYMTTTTICGLISGLYIWWNKKRFTLTKKNSLLFAFQINIWNAQKVIIKWMWNTKKKLNKEN